MRRYGCKISFNNKSKYDGLRGLHTHANNLLRRYLNFCEGILTSLIDSFFVVFVFDFEECSDSPNVQAFKILRSLLWNLFWTFKECSSFQASCWECAVSSSCMQKWFARASWLGPRPSLRHNSRTKGWKGSLRLAWRSALYSAKSPSTSIE